MTLKFGIYTLKCCELKPDKTEIHTSNHLIKSSTSPCKSFITFCVAGVCEGKEKAQKHGTAKQSFPLFCGSSAGLQ